MKTVSPIIKALMVFDARRLDMGNRYHGSGFTLSILLLLSVFNAIIVSTDSMSSTTLYQTLNPSNANGRASTPEVFLSSGGAANGDELPGAIAATAGGYLVGGDFNRTMTFGAHSLAPTSPFSNGNELFLASISEAGVWNYLAGGDHSLGGVSFLTDVASSANTAYVTAYMYGPISFGATSVSTSVLDGVVASAGPTGNWLWAKSFQTLPNSSSDLSIPQAMTVDATGDVIVAGYFSGETDFGGTTINVSNEEIFIAKLDGMNGALKWVVSGGGIGAQRVTDIIVDNSGTIILSGVTQNNVIFGSKTYTVTGTQDSFVLKLNTAGNFLSIAGYGIASQAVSVTNLATDASGNLYLGGLFQGTLTKNGWSITATKGGADVFFIKDTGVPATSWATTGGSNTNDVLTGMQVTSRNEVVFSGYITSSFTAGTKGVAPKGNYDGLLGGLTASGAWSWLDVSNSNDYEANFDLAINSSDIIATAGAFANANPATMTKGSTTITSYGGWDTYVWSINPSMKSDSDNDGIPDYNDNCPTISNPSQSNTDGDAQGDDCDSDDDNDGITDNSPDSCARGGEANWQSTQDFDNPANSSDWDRDGCKDFTEDNDIDNDGVENGQDSCPRSSYSPPRPNWVSDAITDVDGDGCRDADEDDDDDGDGFEDVQDDCPTTIGTSTLGEEGCLDSDGDGWSNNFDDCPTEAGNSTLGGKNACPDTDGDGWANVDDAFVNDPSQWADTDSDGYGDHPLGTTPDECISVAGTSTIDRLGCVDSDGDGYSDPDNAWDIESGADAFINDPTQWSDFDGDGIGDNYANSSWVDRNPSWPGEFNPDVQTQDACPTQEGTSWRNGMLGCPDQDGDGWYNLQDAFPNDPTQWADADGDGYGDNASGNRPDACPNFAGTSDADRYGCEDTDGDGYSDPEISWTPLQGADALSDDPTQWEDADYDGFGDNPEGNTPDACSNEFGKSTIDRYGCVDSDGDGLSDPDTFWAIEQGADACHLVKGNSTADRIGCKDSDGDGYSDPSTDWSIADGADAYPEDPMRWILEVKDDESMLSSSTTLIGGVIALLVILAVAGFVLKGRGGSMQEEKYHVTELNMFAPQYAAQPQQSFAGYPAQTTAPPMMQPAYAGQPAYSPPVAQPDPAREYYNGLIAQGYPHDEAMRYTVQYYPHFQA